MSDDEIDAELEERLYAQIHHQEDESYTELSANQETTDPQIQLSIDVDPIKRRHLGNRYFVDSPVPRPGPKLHVNSYRGPPPNRRLTTATVLGIGGKMAEGQTTNKPVEAKGFKAYSSILASISAPPEPSSQNKNFRKPQNVTKKGQLENRPDSQLSKLERVQKYLAKAQRVELAKKKTKKQQQLQKANPVATIALDSSSSDDDDVIEIPVPPPPLVCLDDSSDDSMQAPPTKAVAPAASRASRCSSPSSSIISDDFLAPLDRNCFSDSMDSVNMTEEDLRAAKAKTSVAKTLDKKKEAGKSKKPSQSKSATPVATTDAPSTATSTPNCKTAKLRIPLLYKNLIASQKDVTIEHYHEDASNADDVVLVSTQLDAAVEEPSIGEIPEPAAATTITSLPAPSSKKAARIRSTSTGDSVYAKGSNSGKSKREAPKETSLDATSDSEVDEGVIQSVEKPSKTSKTPSTTTNTSASATAASSATKPAKTTKKRKSITEESSYSDAETPSVSYIHSGEAVSNAQTSLKRRDGKKRQRLSTLTKTPESDNAFMSMISTIAQGGDVSDSDSVEMLPSTIEEVTICSSDDQAKEVAVEKGRLCKGPTMTFNEFPHDSVLKLVPIERKEEWAINDADRMGYSPPMHRIRCLNCHQMGHIRARCPMPYKPPVCYMCGETGHLEPRCRKTVCLMCGSNTRTYQIRCSQCQNMTGNRCTNCRALGHAACVCPELWRRYHDTTEDVFKLTPLSGTLVKRPRSCSVCGRRGHSAVDCRLSGAFLEFRPAPMAIVRYQSIYPGSRRNDREERRPPSRNTRQQEEDDSVDDRAKERRRAGGEEGKCRWNKDEVQAPEQVIQAEKIARVEREAPSVEAVVIPVGSVKDQPEKVPVAFKIVVDVQSDERQVTSTTKNLEASSSIAPPDVTSIVPLPPTMHVRKMSPNSDSNYSFSDFFEKEKQLNEAAQEGGGAAASQLDNVPKETVAVASVAEDFISIDSPSSTTTGGAAAVAVEVSNVPQVSSSLQPIQESPKQASSEARVYLTKEHSKILINQKGSEFLRQMSEKFSIRVRLEWQSVGNLLTISGSEQNQSAFHAQLTAFLNEVENCNFYSLDDKLPVKRDRFILAINVSIGRLNNNLGNGYDLLRRLGRGFQGKKGKKEADKARKHLNMMLFGQAGLRDGKRRLDALKQSLVQLKQEKTAATLVDDRVREEIEANHRYIFSAMKHDNYPELLKQYYNWKRGQSPANPVDPK